MFSAIQAFLQHDRDGAVLFRHAQAGAYLLSLRHAPAQQGSMHLPAAVAAVVAEDLLEHIAEIEKPWRSLRLNSARFDATIDSDSPARA